MIDYQKLQNWRAKRLCCHFRLSAVVAIARVSFLELRVVENPRFAVRIVILSVIFPELSISGFRASLSFPVVGHCHNHFSVVENPGLAVGISTLSVAVQVL